VPACHTAGNETLTVLRFHKPIGVLRAILKRIASFHACWELVKTQRPLGGFLQGYVRIEFST
jgi:hypothetical protein